MRAVPLCPLAIAAVLLCLPAPAAEGFGDIAGTVVDGTGDPVAEAHVALVRRDNRFRRELVADQQGKYQALGVPAGSYVVVARSARTGASASVVTDIRDGQNVNLPVTLPAAWTVFGSQDSPSAPSENGNYLDAMRNGSEVTRGQEGGNLEGYTPNSPRGNSSFNSLGQRGQDNNFQIDGVDNNDSWLRGAVLMPPAAAIESVSLSEVYIPAALGHATGGSVDVETRAGSGQFHGSAFDHLRNSALDARNFFDGANKPGLTQNQFGASAGGPLQKNSWFWFVDAEALRGRQGLTVISTVPTAAQKAGDFGATTIYDPLSIAAIGDNRFLRQPFAGNQIPSGRTSPAGLAVASLYPDPNLPGIADNYRFTPDQIQNGSWFNARTDKMISSRNTLFGRISYQRQDLQSPSALPGIIANDSSQHADGADTRVTAWGGAVSDAFQVSPALTNEIHASVNRLNLNGQPLDQGFNPSAALGIPGLGDDGMPVINAEGFTQLGAAESVPVDVRTTSFQFEDTMHWKTARHTWEFGVQAIRRQVDGSSSEWTSRGTFLFTPDYTGQPGVGLAGDSMASLETGYPTEVMRDVQLSPFRIRGWEWAGFAQDEIRIGKKLRIQGGLRYSLDPPVTEANNNMVNFNFDRQVPALNQFAGQNGVNSYGGLGFNKWTIAPRIGFALDVFGSGSTVLRGGFSKAYDTGSYISEGILAQNPPYASRLDLINGTFQVGPGLSAGLPAPQALTQFDAASLNSAHASIYAIQPDHYTPYADQWGLFLEQRLRPQLTLEVAGMGSMGIHLYETFDANQPYPAPTPYAFPRYPYEPYQSRIEYLGFAGGSTYYGGQVKLAGRPAPGLQLLMTFRYAKSLDDSTAPGTDQDSRPSTPQYIYNLRGNRSASPFDIANRLVLTAAYDLPFRNPPGQKGASLLRSVIANWRTAAVITAQSGLPFTPQLAINSLNNGGYQLPDRVANGALPAGQQSYLQWFNTSLNPADPNRAFAVPALYQYGNSGFDILRGPGMTTADISLARTFPLRERLRLETRVEAFNSLNQTNFALPNRILGVESSGAISHTSTPARQMQVVVRVEW
jgi:hypothetical protein